MTKQSRAVIKAQNASTIKENNNQEITPTKDRALRNNVADSFLNLVDGGHEIEQETGYSTALNVTNPNSFIRLGQAETLTPDLSGYLPKSAGSGEALTGALYMGDNLIYNVTALVRQTLGLDTSVLQLASGGQSYFNIQRPDGSLSSFLLDAQSGGFQFSGSYVNGGNEADGVFNYNPFDGIKFTTNNNLFSPQIKADNLDASYEVQFPVKSGNQTFAMLSDIAGVGTGTVTSVSVATANGFSGSVSNPTTTPSITLTLQNASTSQNGQLTSTDWNTFNSKQGALTLTTTGSSGASTLVGNTLNIPTYTLTGLGGFANPMTTSGDVIYGGASGVPTRLAIGLADGRVLTRVSGIPAWQGEYLENAGTGVLRIGIGSTHGNANSTHIGQGSGQTSTLVNSTTQIGYQNRSSGSQALNSIGKGNTTTNAQFGTVISTDSAIVMKTGSRLIRIGDTLSWDWSADSLAYSALIIGNGITMSSQRSITWVGHSGEISNAGAAGVETDGIAGFGSGVKILAGRGTAFGANSYTDGISCSAWGYSAKAKKSTLESGAFAHADAIARGAYAGLSGTMVFGSSSTLDFYFSNGWTHRYLDGNTANITLLDQSTRAVKIHGLDAYDDIDGTSVNQPGGAIEIWAGRATGSGTSGNISFKITDPTNLGGNVKQAAREVGRFTPTSFGMGFSTSGFLLQGSFSSTRLTAVTIWPDLSSRNLGDSSAQWNSVFMNSPFIKGGTNRKIGAATLVGGTVTVANTSITTNSRIFLSPVGNTNQGLLDYTISAGASFTIRSAQPLDTRVVHYFIVEEF